MVKFEDLQNYCFNKELKKQQKAQAKAERKGLRKAAKAERHQKEYALLRDLLQPGTYCSGRFNKMLYKGMKEGAYKIELYQSSLKFVRREFIEASAPDLVRPRWSRRHMVEVGKIFEEQGYTVKFYNDSLYVYLPKPTDEAIVKRIQEQVRHLQGGSND